MSNEVKVLKGNTFNYEFKPAQLEIKDYDTLIETAEQVAKHYNSLVLKGASLKDINQDHRELNSFIKGLEENRKSVKRDYQKPLKEFEAKVKKIVKILDEPLQDIKHARDTILNAQEEVRHEALIDYIENKIKGTVVKIGDLELKQEWTNKGNWTEKLNPRKTLKEDIKRDIDLLKEEHKRYLADRKVLETFLDEKDMEHEGWVSQLDNKSSADIIQEIMRVDEQRKQRKKQEEQQEMQKQQQIQEHEKKTQQKQQVTNYDDAKRESSKQEEIYSEVIEIRSTKAKLKMLSDFMVQNEIAYMTYEVNTDDLPF